MKEIIFWAVLVAVIIVAMILIGCQPQQRAPTLVEQMPEEGKILANLLQDLPKTFNLLVLVFVGGLVFWGYSRSKQGWVIPASAVGGMVLMVVFAAYADWIAAGVVAIALGLLIWKAVEYQRERNANGKDNNK